MNCVPTGILGVMNCVPSAIWLRHQLFALHVGIEDIFVATIDGFGIFQGLVAVGIGHAARKEGRTTERKFEQLSFFTADQTGL